MGAPTQLMEDLMPDLPTNKRELRRVIFEAWRRGVIDSQIRLENEADRLELSDYRYASSLRDGAEMLQGLIRRGRGGR